LRPSWSAPRFKELTCRALPRAKGSFSESVVVLPLRL
jgi:hypothetical protein